MLLVALCVALWDVLDAPAFDVFGLVEALCCALPCMLFAFSDIFGVDVLVPELAALVPAFMSDVEPPVPLFVLELAVLLFPLLYAGVLLDAPCELAEVLGGFVDPDSEPNAT